jgi:hypothetical protein
MGTNSGRSPVQLAPFAHFFIGIGSGVSAGFSLKILATKVDVMKAKGYEQAKVYFFRYIGRVKMTFLRVVLFLIALHVSFLLSTFKVNAQAVVTIPGGTAVELELQQNISSKTSEVGNLVDFSAIYAVAVNGITVIEKGAFVRGRLKGAR